MGAIQKPGLVGFGDGRKTTIFDVCDNYDNLNTPVRKKIKYYSPHEEILAAYE